MATTYIVTGTSPSGCAATDTVHVDVAPSPSVDAGADQTIPEGDTTTLIAIGSGGVPPYSYTWEPGGLSGFSVEVGPTDTTEYVVTITSVNGCETSDTVIVNVDGLVNQTPDIEGDWLQVFPNPGDGHFNLKIQLTYKAQLQCEVQDIRGMQVAQWSESFSSGTNLAKLNLSHLAKGIYVLKVNTEEGELVRKLVIE